MIRMSAESEEEKDRLLEEEEDGDFEDDFDEEAILDMMDPDREEGDDPINLPSRDEDDPDWEDDDLLGLDDEYEDMEDEDDDGE